MTEAEIFACAVLAVEKFAKRLQAHPRLEEDPVCVIATECERYCTELEVAGDTPGKQAARIIVQQLTPKKNGRHK